MRGLFTRWSFITLLLLLSVGFLGSHFFTISPNLEVAPPFSTPLWLNRNLPPTMAITLSDTSVEAHVDWEYEAPSQVHLSGKVTLAAPAALIWETPSKRMILQKLPGGASFFDIDSRDLSFKQMLGLSPFTQVAGALFSEKGKYSLKLEPAQAIDGTIILHLKGGRWGFLGTDQRGRDIFALFIAGIRVSLIVGISATLLASLLGLFFGLASGYKGGWVDGAIMRAVDIILSIPILPILMVLAAFWGKGLWQLVLILSLFSWMGTARTVRAMTLSLRDSYYIEGLRGLGAPTFYILWRHLLPETLPLLLANIALGVPGAILAEAGISFLGLSDPRIISWGRMLHEAHSFGAFTQGAWWMLIPPGLGITLLCLIFLDLGKFLEEQVDPQLKEARRL